MSKVTKQELRQRCIDNEAAIARLELILKQNGIEPKPTLKQLDHSVFDGQDEKWRFAAVDSNGEVRLQTERPVINTTNKIWICSGLPEKSVGMKYDTTNWENSLIEREPKDLMGSDLCRAMLERGDKIVTCATSDMSDADAVEYENYDAITRFDGELNYPFESHSNSYKYTVPVNNQGEPLTAADVGLGGQHS